MNAQKIAAILLIVGGLAGLAYGGFSYTKETHQADLGPLHMTVAEKEHVNVPVWVGLGAVLIGGLLLVMGRKS
jgi:hypothetical protein